MENCSDVVAITIFACQISQCLADNEIEQLAADLDLLSDALNSILVRRSTN